NKARQVLNAKIGLHVCGGNARRKRVYFTKYDDLAAAFSATQIDQVSLEYCTLSYNMLTLWDKCHFNGEFAVGVIDQRSDTMEMPEVVAEGTRPVLEYSIRNDCRWHPNVDFSTFHSISRAANWARWWTAPAICAPRDRRRTRLPLERATDLER